MHIGPFDEKATLAAKWRLPPALRDQSAIARLTQVIVHPVHISKTARSADSAPDLKAAVDAHEKAMLETALGCHRYNQRQTAKALGQSYDQLHHTM